MPGKLVSRMSKRECFTLSEKDTVKSASQKYHEKKIGCMPVVDESKKVTGILSERDLSRSIYTEKFNLTLPVSELMSKSLVTCDLNTFVRYTSEHNDEHNSSTVNLKKTCFFKNLFTFSLRFWCGRRDSNSKGLD